MMSSKNYLQGFKVLDTPWLRKQVEGHIVWGGFLAKRKFLWGVVAVVIGIVCNGLMRSLENSDFITLFFNAQSLIIIGVVVFYFRLMGYYQAALAWIATKCGAFLFCLLCILTGVIKVLQGMPWGRYQVLLGLIWMPSIEFHPFLSNYQKLVSIMRIVLTAVAIYFFYLSGKW